MLAIKPCYSQLICAGNKIWPAGLTYGGKISSLGAMGRQAALHTCNMLCCTQSQRRQLLFLTETCRRDVCNPGFCLVVVAPLTQLYYEASKWGMRCLVGSYENCSTGRKKCASWRFLKWKIGLTAQGENVTLPLLIYIFSQWINVLVSDLCANLKGY